MTETKNKELIMPSEQTIRLSLPSKGRLESSALEFLSAAGLRVLKPNPRQYQANLPALPDLGIIFQRPGDIVVSVRQGSVDFGITGLDMIEQKRGENGDIIILYDALGFGHCALALAIPEAWESVTDIPSLKKFAGTLDHPLRVATKFPSLTAR
ncbi:MAG TPA: ATP phosphoribosyltransferase, partial [Anaerolineales bacterium]|nr:ATP phosphoribosyltransferase [Anaerolineales bacterium]